MNQAYARRLWQEGRLPCIVVTVLLVACTVVLPKLGGHTQLLRATPGPLRESSLTELSLTLVRFGVSLLVLFLGRHGLAVEQSNGSLRYLAAHVASRRKLAITLWSMRALQLGAVTLLSMLPLLTWFSFGLVSRAAFWIFVGAYLFFSCLELAGVVLRSYWLGFLLVLPGFWIFQVTFSILASTYHWRLVEPTFYLLNQWLMVPLMLRTGSSMWLAFVVALGWTAGCFLFGLLCGEWLERTEVRPTRHAMVM